MSGRTARLEYREAVARRDGREDARADRRREPSRENIALWMGWGFCGALAVAILARILSTPLTADEVEGVHTAWKIAQGQRIYLDFFQHHHPLSYALQSLVVRAFGEQSSTLIACRLAQLPFLAGIFFATYRVASNVFSAKDGLLALLFLMTSIAFLAKAIEVRPDVPMVCFTMLAVALLFPRSRQPSLASHALAGVCMAIALMFLQKAVFTIAALGAILLWRAFRREIGLKALACTAAGFAAIAPFVLWIFLYNDPQEYFFLNWILNINYLNEFSAVKAFVKIYAVQGALFGFAALGVLRGAGNDRQRQLAFLTICLGVAPVFMRAPYLQYWLPLLPLASIYAGRGLGVLIPKLRPAPLAVSALILFMPGALWVLFVPAERLITNPASQVEELQAQLKRIDYVLSVTDKDDLVYDGAVVFNVFREDLDYIWYGVQPKNNLESYRALRPYPYDIYELIDRKRPKLISMHLIANQDDPRIKSHYQRSDRYSKLLIRRD